jgi:CBS domain containing-hemolysin-like protein
MTIKEALSYRKERLEDVAKCYKNESLSTCMERIIKAEVHRLVVVDNDEHVIGVLSLSDLLYYIVIRPTKTTPPTTTLPMLVPTINVSHADSPVEVEAIEKN